MPSNQMEYSHSRKAGNRGDVWKHAVLVALADSIPLGTEALYVESHCGAPVHQLTRGGEWQQGVGRLVGEKLCESAYVTVAESWVQRRQYPASWVIVVNRFADRNVKIKAVLADVSGSVAMAYQTQAHAKLAPTVMVEFHQLDGYILAASIERADLVFIDPPFHPVADKDWRMLTHTCIRLTERNVPFVAWYPFYSPTRP